MLSLRLLEAMRLAMDRTRMRGWMWTFVLALLPTTLCAAESEATRAFTQLSGLVGQWQGKFADGRAHSVAYRLTAGGSVLMETWALAPGRESITLYHLDGEALMATHYCPQGNQPRLQLVPSGTPGRLDFAFRDGTNLQVEGKAHQHAFWLEFLDDGRFKRNETYVENGTPPSEPVAPNDADTVVYSKMP